MAWIILRMRISITKRDLINTIKLKKIGLDENTYIKITSVIKTIFLQIYLLLK